MIIYRTMRAGGARVATLPAGAMASFAPRPSRVQELDRTVLAAVGLQGRPQRRARAEEQPFSLQERTDADAALRDR